MCALPPKSVAEKRWCVVLLLLSTVVSRYSKKYMSRYWLLFVIIQGIVVLLKRAASCLRLSRHESSSTATWPTPQRNLDWRLFRWLIHRHGIIGERPRESSASYKEPLTPLRSRPFSASPQKTLLDQYLQEFPSRGGSCFATSYSPRISSHSLVSITRPLSTYRSYGTQLTLTR